MKCRSAASMVLLCVTVTSACRTTPVPEPVGALPAQPMLGVGAVADDPAVAALPPCQISAEVVAARATQTLAEAMMERDLSLQVVSMLRRVVHSRCAQDGWSEPTLRCYRDATVDTDPMVVCADTMSPEQLQRLTVDVGAEADRLRAAMH
ncbi:MAG: hypothetical protein KBG15_08175 [Kofleriaceae bacterium]|nr:hypothetical protein [Kofleriaceae bacterium]